MQRLPRRGQIRLRFKILLKNMKTLTRGYGWCFGEKLPAEKLRRAQASRYGWDSSFRWKIRKRSQGDTVDRLVNSCAPEKLRRAQASRYGWDLSFRWKIRKRSQGDTVEVSVKSCAPEKLRRAQALRYGWDSSFHWKIWKCSPGDTVEGVGEKLRSWKTAARAGAQIWLRFYVSLKNLKTLTRGFG